MERQDHYHGSLVAFEGPADTVSTQLRLLPISPQVLILPSIQTYMGGGDDGRFNARSLVRKIHKATQARHDVAMGFLRGSSANNKRIVFLSGGTAGAVSQCISAISQHQVSGDVSKAELLFRRIAQDGVGGLDKDERYSDQRTLQTPSSEYDPGEAYWGNDEVEDPRTKAMRAADALYEETESLQPIDCFSRTRPQSLSLPMYDHADGVCEPSPFFVFGSPPNGEFQSVCDTDSEEPTNYLQILEDDFAGETPKRSQNEDTKGPWGLPRPPICVGEPYKHHTAENRTTLKLHSQREDASLSPPTTPDGVVYGEARLVQMRASSASKSPSDSRMLEELRLHQTSRRQTHAVSAAHVSRGREKTQVPEADNWHLPVIEDPYPGNNLFHIPRARYVKAHTTTIRKSPAGAKRPPMPTREFYVCRGTDTAVFDDEQSALGESFRPVLPLTEDLVIQFSGEARDQILESVIQSFKSGSFPVPPFSPASLRSGLSYTRTSTAIRTAPGDLFNSKDQAWLPRVAEYSSDEDSEYAQFTVREYGVRSSNLALQNPSPPSAVSVYTGQLPTPSQTPPPSVVEDTESRFHHLSTAGRRNAVIIQNELRSVLEVYFPPQRDGGYQQFSFPLLPDMNSMWRPISRESVVHENKMTERSTDLILAIGCQRGVKRDFLPALMGRIERLGTKSTGISRSGRLDIRYLIVNTMQSFTAQPLARQTHNNPFENPYLLACLIIPHLETYLAAHPSIRFLLLEYPAEHLATVLALQKLVGISVLKVVGIINSDATSPSSDASSSPSSTYSSRSGTLFNKTDANSLDSISLGATPFPDSRQALAPRRKHPLSGANYLLTCSATGPETAAFISTICKLLVEADPFYGPERNQPPQGRPGTARSTRDTITTRAGTLPRLVGDPTIQGRDRSPAYTHMAVRGPAGLSPPTSPHRTSGGGGDGGSSSSSSSSSSTPRAAGPAAAPPPPPPSPSTTTTTTVSTRSGRGPPPGSATRRGVAGALGGADDDGASLYAVSVVGEGEFYDDEERRLMPMYVMRQRELRRGNSRKALKWLGLA